MTRPIVLALFLLAMAAGCATAPGPVAPEPVDKPEAAAAPAAELDATPEAEPKTSARSPLTGAAARTEVQKILRQSFDWLDAGEVEKAKGELEYAHELEPDNKQVNCLLRGITADPLAALGKESTAYTVRPGETLGLIARRAMGDVCEFYILARYNQIKIPKLLSSGQTIRIPGRIALGAPEVAPVVKPVAPTPKPDTAPVVEAVKPKPVPPAESDDRAKRAEIDRHHRNAQAAYRRQDLTTAIREWDAVLALDSNNDLARARRQEALNLQRRLEELKK